MKPDKCILALQFFCYKLPHGVWQIGENQTKICGFEQVKKSERVCLCGGKLQNSSGFYCESYEQHIILHRIDD